MTFEEEFPSLKGLRMEGFVEEDNTLGYSLEADGEYIQVYDVETKCLDKEKVLEIARELAKDTSQKELDFLNKFLKELGLE